MPRTPYYVTLYFSQKIICNRSVLSQNDVLPNDYFCLSIKEYGAAARTADPCATAPYNIYDIRSETLSPILFYAFSILIAHTLYSGILAYFVKCGVGQPVCISIRGSGMASSSHPVRSLYLHERRFNGSSSGRNSDFITVFDTQLIGIYDVHFDK